MENLTLPSTPFRRSDLAALGLTPKRLRSLEAASQVRRVARGVYVADAVPDTLELRALAVALVAPAGHVAIDRTASWLHGVDAYARTELADAPAIETCALPGHNPSHRAGVSGHTRDLRASDIMITHGMRVTTPLRTALDLGCHLRRREAFAALCEIARAHEIAPRDLAAGVTRFAKRRGVVQLRELVPLVEPRIESPREAWTLLAISDAGLPLPEPQVWVDRDGVPTYRLDLAYRAHRICIEYNGFDAHERTDEQRESDRARVAWLQSEGWTVIVVRLGDFTSPALDRWLDTLRQALRDAGSYSTRRW